MFVICMVSTRVLLHATVVVKDFQHLVCGENITSACYSCSILVTTVGE